MFYRYQVQEKVKCCGATAYEDYFNRTVNGTEVKESVPKSCCIDQAAGTKCPYADLRGVTNLTSVIYTHGCYDTLLHDMKVNVLTIAAVLGGIVVFQLLGAASAYIVSKKLQPEPLYERV